MTREFPVIEDDDENGEEKTLIVLIFSWCEECEVWTDSLHECFLATTI